MPQLQLTPAEGRELDKAVVAGVGGGVTAALASWLGCDVVGCGRPAPGGFPVPLCLMYYCFRLQEEMLQREEAESTLQSFRQVCSQQPHPPKPLAVLKVTSPRI